MKEFLRKVVAITGAGLIALLIFDVLLPHGQRLYQFGIGSEDTLRTSDALFHPVRYIHMVLSTYIAEADEILIGVGGTRLAWMEDTLPYVLVGALLLTIVICGMYERDRVLLRRYDRAVLVMTLILAYLSIPAMLLGDTSRASRIISGLQGRYYLPVLPVMMLLLSKGVWYRGHALPEGAPAEGTLRGYRCFAVLTCIAVYYMMRLYLTR